MIQKRDGILILISLLLLVTGIYSVNGGTGQSIDNGQLTFVNTTMKIGNYQINATQNTFADKWAKPGSDIVVNFTITNTGIGNISVINITIPDHVFKLNFGTGPNNGTSWNNITRYFMFNSSKSVWIQNLTSPARLGNDIATGELVNGTTAGLWNTTLFTTTNATIWFNITALANVTTEDVYTFMIATQGRIPGGLNANASHNLTIGIDGRGPRILDINITEINNGVLSGRVLKLFNGGLNGTVSLSPNAAFNITVVVNDTNFNATDGSVIVYWNTTSPSTTPRDITINESIGMNRVELVRVSNERLSRLGPIVFQGELIPKNTLNATNVSAFIIVVNDTFNNKVAYNSTGHSFNFSVENQAPIFSNLNVTDANGNVLKADSSQLNGSNYLLADSAYAIRVTITDPSLNATYPRSVMIAYNSSTRGIPSIANLLGTANQHANFTINMTTTDTTSPFMYNGSIPKGTFNNTNQSVFMLYANDSLYGNPAAVLNWSNGSGAVTRGFNFTADGSAPVIDSITAPATTVIDITNSISYTCAASDALSGVTSITVTITKPGGTTVSKTGLTGTSYAASFSSTDTDQAGTYTVECTAKDNVGITGASTSDQKKTFIAQFSTSSGSSSGGSSGGSGTTTPAVDADFSQAGIDSATFVSNQGRTKVFVLSGTARHTLKFDIVTETEATLTIASANPTTITLQIGETKEVDMNSDGTNDLSVMLDKITAGRATIVLTELTGAATVDAPVQEEIQEVCGNGVCGQGETYASCPTDCNAPGTTDTTTGETTTSTGGNNMTWVWVVLLILLVGIGVYFVLRKRKK